MGDRQSSCKQTNKWKNDHVIMYLHTIFHKYGDCMAISLCVFIFQKHQGKSTSATFVYHR